MVAPADGTRVRALMALARANAKKASVLEALTDWFASKDAIGAARLPDQMVDALVGIGIDRLAAVKAGEMALSKPLTGRSRYGAPDPYKGMPAMRRVAADEPEMRAQYLLAAARRLTQARAEHTYSAALEAEKRYLDAHVAAGRKRRAAARRIDELGAGGQMLVWRAVMDDRTTPECAALNGRLFTAGDPPGIPGAMHARCRCTAAVWGRGLFLNWGASGVA